MSCELVSCELVNGDLVSCDLVNGDLVIIYYMPYLRGWSGDQPWKQHLMSFSPKVLKSKKSYV